MLLTGLPKRLINTGQKISMTSQRCHFMLFCRKLDFANLITNYSKGDLALKKIVLFWTDENSHKYCTKKTVRIYSDTHPLPLLFE